MALTVETGAGIAGANSYASLSYAIAFWLARPNRAESSVWEAAAAVVQEGALIEATAYLDAEFGPYYRGERAGRAQGLLWPRTNARDNAGALLPDMPEELKLATCELAGRAVSSALAPDANRGGMVTQETVKAGEVSRSTTYSGMAPVAKRYGFVTGLLHEVLNGSQPGAAGDPWAWR